MIANQLQKSGIKSYWIIPNGKQYKTLKTIFPEKQLLYIGKKDVLASQEKEVDFDLKINELVYGDRVLKYEPKNWTFTYLEKLRNLYYNFIKSNDISYIFGEVTWAHELVAHRLTTQAKNLKCEFLNPHTIRIPNGKFAFFTDEFQSNIKLASNISKEVVGKIQLEKPSYLKINDELLQKKRSLSHSLKLLKNFVLRTNQDANDPTLFSNPLIQFKIRAAEIYNRIVFKNFINETSVKSLPEGKKSILFTLHKQPEASIDVIGRYYENQINLIINIWRIMPKDHILLVKEHSNAIGDRKLGFYKTIKKLPNTYLIDNKADSHRLLDIIEAVFTVSGTIAYEAALKGKHAFTFAPAFFNKMNNCSEVSWKDFKYHSFNDLISNQQKCLDANEFSSWLLKNSFEGIMSDAFGNPICVGKKNISNLSKGFLIILK